MDYDAIVVGASVAGSTAALELALRGRRVLLLDRERFPRDKPCGEGLMPVGVAALLERGILPSLLKAGARPFHALRFRHGDRVIEGEFPEAARGLCLRRRVLDETLLRWVESVPGVTVREGFRVVRPLLEGGAVVGVEGEKGTAFRAPVTLGCDGSRSLFHEGCGIVRKMHPRQRWGVTGRVRAKLEPVVEIVFFDGGQAFLSPTGTEECSVALLLEKETIAGFAGRADEAYAGVLRSLGRLEDPRPLEPVRVTGPLGYSVEPIWRPGLLLVGDSAGFFDPITGEGMSAAMLSARAAAEAVGEAFASGDFGGAPFQGYAATYEALLRDITKVTKFLLRVVRRPVAVDRAIDRFSRRPELLEKLLGIAAGSRRWRDVSLRERIFLGTGI